VKSTKTKMFLCGFVRLMDFHESGPYSSRSTIRSHRNHAATRRSKDKTQPEYTHPMGLLILLLLLRHMQQS